MYETYHLITSMFRTSGPLRSDGGNDDDDRRAVYLDRIDVLKNALFMFR